MTDPGWYEDPQQQARYRYWDGQKWTGQTSSAASPPTAAQAAPPSPPGTPPPPGGPPAPVPAPPAPRKGTPIVIKVALGVVLGVVLLIAGCALLIGVGVNEAQKEEQEHAISRAQYESIKNGTPQSEVEDELGAPADAQDFDVKGLPDSSCIYYHEQDDDLASGAFFQFCFDGGKLSSKSAY